MKDFLIFDKLLTPRLLSVIYWICFVFSVSTGFLQFYKAIDFRHGIDLQQFFAGLLIIFLGTVVSRILFELIILKFKINDNLEKLVSSDKKK